MPDSVPPDADFAEEESSSPDAANGSLHPRDPLDSATIGDDEPEGAVPPGYDWPTHGGYLGCLLGLIAACLVGGFVGSSLFAALTHYNWIPGYVTALIVVAVYVVSIVALCYLGWRLGKRFYRAYPQPRGRTWGEHDETVDAVNTESPEPGDGATGDTMGDTSSVEEGASEAEQATSAQAPNADALSDEPANRAGHL